MKYNKYIFKKKKHKGMKKKRFEIEKVDLKVRVLLFCLTAVQIVKPMQDRECSESENVKFEVEVSHPGIDAFWTFKRQPLKAGAKHKMECKNKHHTLTVMNAMKDEEGEYMFAAGEKTCSATLTVSGKNSLKPQTALDQSKGQLTENLLCHQVVLSRSPCET